jgi:uncharacterized protein (UPF0332 family)
MGLPGDLIKLAAEVLNLDKKKPRQVVLRRSVSTAYYALFHLLSEDFANIWRTEDQRSRVARNLTHTRMFEASNTIISRLKKLGSYPSPNLSMLESVTRAFILAQQSRQEADYNAESKLTKTEALALIDQVKTAFENWRKVKNTNEAKEFLYQLHFKDR